MKDRTPKLCPNCGKDHVRRMARPGRIYQYKELSYEIPAAMSLKECPACHEMPMSAEEVEAVEEAVGAMHQQKLTMRGIYLGYVVQPVDDFSDSAGKK